MKENNDCGFLIKQICDKLQASVNRELKESGLTFSQVRYLDYLCTNHLRKVPMKELEMVFNVSQPTVAGIVNRLEKKGLVKTQQSEEDSRAKTVQMTEQGYEEYIFVKSSRERKEHELTEVLSESERKEFQQMLIRICGHLKG